jgi:Vitamin K-dependent gamma-carboxylase
MSAATSVIQRPAGALHRWWFTPLPLGRIAALRVAVYLFSWYDVFFYSPNVLDRVGVPSSYKPIGIDRILQLPMPSHNWALAVKIAVPCVATLAATGRAPRVLGAITFALYLDWITMGDSYGYVPHDRFAFLVALAVLPTVGAARFGDRTASERAGWALRCIQVAVVATYFLSAVAKVRFGGFHWANGAVLTWAFLRRPTPLGSRMLGHPQLLHISQWAGICAETLSPIVLFLRGRYVYLGVAGMLIFHAFNQATLRISFAPHVVCILAFLPLEGLGFSMLLTSSQSAASLQSSGRSHEYMTRTGTPRPARQSEQST